jgi:hypothetical protein
MRAVWARREVGGVSFAQTKRDLLQAIPADILRFVAMPREQDSENVNFALEVSLPIVNASGLRLRGDSPGEQALDDGGSAEPISDFKGRLLRDRSLIVSVVLDPESHDIIGYQVPGGSATDRRTWRGDCVPKRDWARYSVTRPVGLHSRPGHCGENGRRSRHQGRREVAMEMVTAKA